MYEEDNHSKYCPWLFLYKKNCFVAPTKLTSLRKITIYKCTIVHITEYPEKHTQQKHQQTLSRETLMKKYENVLYTKRRKPTTHTGVFVHAKISVQAQLTVYG